MHTNILYKFSGRKYDDCFCHVPAVPVPDDVVPSPLCGWGQSQGQASGGWTDSLHSTGNVVGIYTHTEKPDVLNSHSNIIILSAVLN